MSRLLNGMTSRTAPQVFTAKAIRHSQLMIELQSARKLYRSPFAVAQIEILSRSLSVREIWYSTNAIFVGNSERFIDRSLKHTLFSLGLAAAPRKIFPQSEAQQPKYDTKTKLLWLSSGLKFAFYYVSIYSLIWIIPIVLAFRFFLFLFYGFHLLKMLFFWGTVCARELIKLKLGGFYDRQMFIYEYWAGTQGCRGKWVALRSDLRNHLRRPCRSSRNILMSYIISFTILRFDDKTN